MEPEQRTVGWPFGAMAGMLGGLVGGAIGGVCVMGLQLALGAFQEGTMTSASPPSG